MSVGVEEIVRDQEKQECMRLSFCHIEVAHGAVLLIFLSRDVCKPFSGIFVAKVFSI